MENVIFPMLVRGFCDTGSQANLITENCVQLLKIHKHKTHVLITSIACNTVAKSKVLISLAHRWNDNVQIPIEALVVPKIAGCFPDEFVTPSSLPLKELADP